LGSFDAADYPKALTFPSAHFALSPELAVSKRPDLSGLGEALSTGQLQDYYLELLSEKERSDGEGMEPTLRRQTPRPHRSAVEISGWIPEEQ
jgi:hypothetical protein